MYLDDLDSFRKLDPDNMLGHIDALPDQVEQAWAYAASLDMPPDIRRVDKIIICGMGGSAIGGDLLAALVADECNVPVIVNRDFDLPAYASGQTTLVIACSYSGNTAETLAAFDLAVQRDTQLMVITTGGKLAEAAREHKATLWTFEYASQPRAALGWQFTLLLALFSRSGLVADQTQYVEATVKALRRHRETLTATSIAARNPAKRYAGQLIGRIAVFYGAGLMVPVARRWKTQLNENGKAWAHYEELPEMNHNSIVGIVNPDERLPYIAIIQLTAPGFDLPENIQRHEATKKLLLENGIIPDTVAARGNSRLEAMFSLLQFGDYLSYYVAMGNQVDPTPVTPIQMLKAMLQS